MRPTNLKAQRATRNISQAKLADILGVTVATVSRWECGHTTISDAYAALIREKLREYDARAI